MNDLGVVNIGEGAQESFSGSGSTIGVREYIDSELKNIKKETEERAEEILETNRKEFKEDLKSTNKLVVIGFIMLGAIVAAMLIAFFGLIFAYWQFTYLGNEERNKIINNIKDRLESFELKIEYMELNTEQKYQIRLR